MNLQSFSPTFNCFSVIVATYCQYAWPVFHQQDKVRPSEVGETKSPFASLSLCVFVWGRFVIVLVNERVSINTPKASFSVSATNQQSLFS